MQVIPSMQIVWMCTNCWLALWQMMVLLSIGGKAVTSVFNTHPILVDHMLVLLWQMVLRISWNS